MNEQTKKVTDIVSDLVKRGFWGKIELTFRNGRITFLKREETEAFEEPRPRQLPTSKEA